MVAVGLEACDDGNTDDTDACRTDCVRASCGDGAVQEAEACDDGNPDDTDGCRSNCLVARCGDGAVEAGVEACDDGNDVDSDGCRDDCTVARCGDGVVRKGFEHCDDGNADDSDSCVAGCKRSRAAATASSTSASRTATTATRSTPTRAPACARTAACGDGVVEEGVEECDDGNDTATDQCAPGCLVAVCGDGYVAKKNELCDDGNQVDGDGCSSRCVPTLINPSFEAGDYTGWVLRESSPQPTYGVWGIGASEQSIEPGELVYDFRDQVSSRANCLPVPLDIAAAEGDAYAFNLQAGPEDHRMSQDIFLPPTITTLGWSMGYHNYWGSFVADAQFLAVQLRDPATDEVLATLYKTGEGDPQQLPMTAFEADIRAFAGRTVRIDVELQVQLTCFDGEFDDFTLR